MNRIHTLIWLVGAAVLASAGCTSISIAPSCPNELNVGQSGTVNAHEVNPGAIATYLWEVFPSDAGEFTSPAEAVTTFEAQRTGEVVIRLTASDGLYQVISSCTTRIVDAAVVAVSLAADPSEAEVGEIVALTCTSTGASVALGVPIEHDGDPSGTLTEVSVGTSEFVPDEVGQFTFRCVGVDINSVRSDPSLTTVTVIAATNDNSNDNSAPPGGGGRR